MGMPPNLHSVHCSRQPLCIHCKQCGRRAILEHEQINAHSGNMKPLTDLKLKCINCGSRDYLMWVFVRAQHVSDFMAGTPLETLPGECIDSNPPPPKPPKGSIADRAAPLR
jgi:hypothetical protein